MTFVTDQALANEGAFGVEAGDTLPNGDYQQGETFRFEIGGYLNLTYRKEILKNILVYNWEIL